jgi:PTS system cellobiose-specific IIC component
VSQTSKYAERLKVIEDKLYSAMAAFAANRYVDALRSGMASLIPFLLAGSIFLIIAFFPVPAWMQYLQSTGLFGKLLSVVTASYGLLALWLAFNLGRALAEHYRQYEVDPIFTGLLCAASFFIVAAPTGAIDWLGGTGLFVAIPWSFLVTEIVRLMYQYKIYIRLPPQVPPFITRAFRAVLAFAVVFALAFFAAPLPGINLAEAFNKAITPAIKATDTPEMFAIANFITVFGWTFGIHPLTFAAPFYTFSLPNLEANIKAHAMGLPPPHIFAGTFWYMCQNIGGTGNHLALAVLCILFAKSRTAKRIGWLALPPAIFNINEPILFGLPVAWNPILMIPTWVAVTLASYIWGWLAYANVIGRPVAYVEWSVPSFLNTYLMTLDWRAPLAQFLVGFVLSALIFYPFFRIYDRYLLEQEQKEAAGQKAQ